MLKGDTLIERIWGKKIVGVRHVNLLPDGTLVGMAMLEDGRAMPFRGDTLLEEVQGRRALHPSASTHARWHCNGDEVHLPLPL